MNILTLSSSRTAVEIALWRHGWAWPLAAALGICAVVGHVMVLQPGRRMQEAALLELAQEAKRPTGPAGRTQHSASSDGEQRLQALRAAFRSSAETGEPVRRMAALAQTEQISLSQGEYQQQVNTLIGITRVQISQPVRASYPQLRRYIEAVLQAMPNASLDQVTARRDNVGQALVEARLRWSLWTDTAPPAAATPAASRKDATP